MREPWIAGMLGLVGFNRLFVDRFCRIARLGRSSYRGVVRLQLREGKSYQIKFFTFI